MNSFDDALWTSLDTMRIAPTGAALTFEARLAREQGWRDAYAERVVREYRRFLYLAARGDHPVTPSVAVDEAWHLHLTYTRHYWETLVPDILRRPLHHTPTEGGPAERARFFDQYARTLKDYEATFGEAPPADIWPSPEKRFGSRRRVEVGVMATVGGACLMLAASTMLMGNTSPKGVMPSLAILIPVVIGFFIFGTIAAVILGAEMVRKKEDGTCASLFSSSSSSPGGDCGGGCGGGCS